MGVKENKGCLTTILRVLGLRPHPVGEETWPYRVRDDFLSSAELSFYHVLQTAIADWATVCPKVSLNDLFYAKSGDHKKNVAYRNKIARKHVDFLLCDPRTMTPLLGVELDDARPVPPSTSESVPPCPKCGQPMVLRVSKKEGPHKGKEFWGCRDYPRCRGLREYVPEH